LEFFFIYIFYKPTQHTNRRHKPARGIAPTWHLITVKRRGRIIFIRIGLVSQSDLRIEVVCAMDPIRIGMNRTASVKTSGWIGSRSIHHITCRLIKKKSWKKGLSELRPDWIDDLLQWISEWTPSFFFEFRFCITHDYVFEFF